MKVRPILLTVLILGRPTPSRRHKLPSARHGTPLDAFSKRLGWPPGAITDTPGPAAT